MFNLALILTASTRRAVLIPCDAWKWLSISLCPWWQRISDMVQQCQVHFCWMSVVSLVQTVSIMLATCHPVSSTASQVCVCVWKFIMHAFLFFITSIADIFHLTHWVYLCVLCSVCVFGPHPSPFQLGQSPVPAVLIISVWRWLAQFSRNRGPVSIFYTLT